MSAAQIAALPSAAPDDEPALDKTQAPAKSAGAVGQEVQPQFVQAPAPRERAQLTPPDLPPAPEQETAEAAAERERAYCEIFGIEEQKPRRWFR